MRAKYFGMFALSILALVFVAGLASADIVFSPTSVNQTFTQGQTLTINFNLVNDGLGGSYTVTWASTSTQGSWTLPSLTSSANGSTNSLTATLTGVSSTFTGTITGNITVTATGGSPTETLPVTLTINPASVPAEVSTCNSLGNPGELNIKRIDFSNKGLQYNTFGEDDQWFPFEEIEAEIKVENNGNDDVDDISVEWGVWDTDKNQWVIELDEEDEINVKDGDEETLTFTFKIDDDMDVSLDELTDGDNYRFYAVATGTVDNSTSPETCISDSEQVSVVIESDFVILDNFDVPTSVQCGDTATITAEAWNVGDNDQDSVSVSVINTELGINEDIDAGDVDAFDNQKASFTFTVPGDAEEKIYKLDFEVRDEDNEVYQDDFDDDESVFSVPLQVSGNCGAVSGGAGGLSVAANIVSGGSEGKEMVVKATATNTGTTQKIYTISVSGYEDWASSFSLDKNSLVLAPAQSGDVSVTLDVKDDVSGSKTFFIEFVSDGQLVRQPVTVSITEGRSGITGFITRDNWYLWGIGFLNILLVIIIIVVAVRIASK